MARSQFHPLEDHIYEVWETEALNLLWPLSWRNSQGQHYSRFTAGTDPSPFL